MTKRPSDIESALTAALQQRSNAYAQAHASLVAVEKQLHAGETPLHAACPELQQALSEIRVADECLAPLQEQWRGLSIRPGPELAAEIQRHQAQLEQTLDIVNKLAGAAETDREMLAPRLDEAARGHRMQTAYAAFGRY